MLVRNDDFFIPGKPYLDRIVMPKIPDPMARALMLENKQIDLAGFAGLTPQTADRLEDEGGLNDLLGDVLRGGLGKLFG